MSESLLHPNTQNDSHSHSHTTQESSGKEMITYAVLALGLALFIRFFIASPWLVSGPSMLPNFQDLNYLIVDRLTYRISEPARGDVIVFGLPQMPSRDLIKRVVGLPHETVTIDKGEVIINNAAHPEGFALSEPYLDANNLGGPDKITVNLGDDEYYVLGDNRRVSADSRTWGTLPRSNIIGRVLLRLFPFDRVALFPAEARYSEENASH